MSKRDFSRSLMKTTHAEMLALQEAEGAPPEMTRTELGECCVVIAEEYHYRKSLTMTLRQLYYRLVATGLIPNGTPSYNRVKAVCSKLRLSGHMGLELLVDRTRTVNTTDSTSASTSVTDALERASRRVKWMPDWLLTMADWKGQPQVCSVWVEKDALTNVFETVCDRLGVGLFAVRGYCSISAAYEWLEHAASASNGDSNTEHVILYFGDHDPDGLAMMDSTFENMQTMLRNGLIPGRCPEGMTSNARESHAEPLLLTIDRVGLTLDQIEQYQPPPFPAKQTSARFKGYHEATGLEDAWELDALEPEVLRDLTAEAVARYWCQDIADDNKARLKGLRAEMREQMRDPDWISEVFDLELVAGDADDGDDR